MSESDLNEQLLTRFQAGDEHAFVELYSQHRERLKQMIEFRMDRRLHRSRRRLRTSCKKFTSMLINGSGTT